MQFVSQGCRGLIFIIVLIEIKEMPSCSAPDCKGITFHNLPANKLLAKKWLEQLRRDERFGLSQKKNIYVCNEHFTDDCFNKNYRFQLLGTKTQRRNLKRDSVPTVFKRNTRSETRVTSERRIANKERKEVSFIIINFCRQNSSVL